MLNRQQIKPVGRQGPAAMRQCVESRQEEPKLKYISNVDVMKIIVEILSLSSGGHVITSVMGQTTLWSNC